MRVEQLVFPAGTAARFGAPTPARLVLVFGGRARFEQQENFDALRAAFPAALIVGCSTAGEIHGTQVSDDSLIVTAIHFDHTQARLATARVETPADSLDAGRGLGEALPAEDLAHVLLFSDGLRVNGTELVRGIKERLPQQVEVTGGLSADGADFRKTLVCADAMPAEGVVAAIGLYGERLRIGYGSLGGWDPFGPERLITRAEGNVLYDLDGKPALELYKRYLGEHANGLPASALLFPLSLRGDDGRGVVRTILGIDETAQSMTFAGDMPQGRYARLMKANFERLVDGAIGAAQTSLQPLREVPAELALLVSCVGRKLVLKQRVEEEVEGVRDVLGEGPVFAGFYSYGEISPLAPGAKCELHNQTMSITTLSET